MEQLDSGNDRSQSIFNRDAPSNLSPFFSIIVPVLNGGDSFARCLQSVQASAFTDRELIVVDDGSSDRSVEIARSFGARLLETGVRSGPGAARNLGAKQAAGRHLFFLDADCELAPEALSIAAKTLIDRPQIDALFGSYDDAPLAVNFISQYKNLMHHFVHQSSREDAHTFWAGCGAIRRERFGQLGGFDARRYPRPSIEDIELGYRLKRLGGQIRLEKSMQVKHLKRWTFRSLLRSDVLDRGVPWTQLILESGQGLPDLNLQLRNRLSALTVVALLGLIPLAFFNRGALLGILLAVIVLIWLNRGLYAFYYRKRGLRFALRALPMHWFFYLNNFLAFGLGTLAWLKDKLT